MLIAKIIGTTVSTIKDEKLTGRKPFEATAEQDLAQQVLHVEAPAVGGLSPFKISEPLAALVAATLAKDMARRPAHAAALDEALAQLATQAPWQRERAKLWWESVHPASPPPEAQTTAA